MRIAVLEGDGAAEVAEVLRECGHEVEPIRRVEDIPDGGAVLPVAVVPHLAGGDRRAMAAIVERLQALGMWVLGAGVPDVLEGLSECGVDDLLALPAETRSVKARLITAARRIAGYGRMSPFFANNPNPMWIFDLSSREILSVNSAAVERYGWSRAEFLKLKIDDLRDPGEIPTLLDALANIDQDAAITNTPSRHRTRTGEVFEVEVHGTRFPYQGRPGRMVLVRDLRMQSRLLMSERLASVGTLAGGVAHEINNPLAVTMANLEFALAELARPESARDVPETLQALKEAREGAERVRQIVRDLHAFARADSERREPIDLPRIVESALAMASNELKHRARLVRELQAVPKVLGNEQRLGQVALALVMNAAQAIPVGHAGDHEIRVRTAVSGGRVLLEVADTGSGIAPENLRRIFDPFFTTKPPGQGTGLGLAMCHAIVAALGGEIHVDSTPGKGSTFRVLLPAATETAAAAPEPATGAAPRRARVLLVDDEPLIGRTVERMLAGEHEVVSLTSASAALDRLTSGEHFDVILCDLMMPEMTGMELYDALGERAPALRSRMVFLTGGAFTPAAEAFLERVARPCVNKPFGIAELRAAIAGRLGAG